MELVNSILFVKISKADIADGKFLEGAHIQIFGKDGKVVEEWVSTKEAHEVTGLKAGEIYTLRETVAPEGYAVAEDITFTIEADGTVKVGETTATDKMVVMRDEKTEVTISKKEIAGSDELPGAKLQILEGKEIVQEWTTSETARVIERLKTGVDYTLHEASAPDGYAVAEDITFTIEADGTVKVGETVANDNIVEMKDMPIVTVNGTKTWNVPDGTKLPEKITVLLKRNGEKIDSQEVTAENGWKYSFDNLPKYSEDGKTAYTYTVDEEALTGYNKTVDGYNITNTITGTTEVSGTKTWNVPEGTTLPESITVNLYRNGSKIDSKEVTAKDEWKYSWSELPVYSSDGMSKYTYTVDEEPIAGYNKTIDGFNITNIRSDKITVEGTKTWNVPEGTTLPESITVNLYQNGTKIDSKTVTVKDDWKYSWIDLAAFSEDGKTAYTYTVDEEEVAGYEKAVSGYNITNTITGTTTVEGTKTWKAPEGTTLPESITVDLYRNGTKLESKTVTAKDNWKYSWGDLASYSEDGKTAYIYTVEETPIEGYISTVDGYNITNTITSVKVSKVDIADGKELEGAHIQILDKDGSVVEEWISTKEAHEITGLKTGETYTLRETVAPDGYDLTTDTTFVLKEDGTVDTAQTTTTTKDGVLLVEDAKTVETDKAIEVTKRLISIDGPVLNAEDATFYVALYADAECTQRVSAVKALEFKNASSATVTFKNLKADTTYYVGECDQDGTSYGVGTTSDGVTYVADFGSSNKVEITNADGTKEVHFDNQFLTVPDGYNVEAYLSITKKVLDVDGNAVNSNETFYAGLFADKDYTTLSTEVSQNIIPLSMDGGSEKTVTLMVPIIPGGTVNLYVTEVDKDGNPVANSKSFAYDVEVSGGEIVLSDEGKTFSVTITNSEQNVETETETETETEVETETEKETQKTTEKKTTKAAKTGDDTPIGALAGALAVSAAVIVIYFKRRKKNEE